MERVDVWNLTSGWILIGYYEEVAWIPAHSWKKLIITAQHLQVCRHNNEIFITFLFIFIISGKVQQDLLPKKSEFIVNQKLMVENGTHPVQLKYGIYLESTKKSFTFMNYFFECKKPADCNSFNMIVLDLDVGKSSLSPRFRGLNLLLKHAGWVYFV